MIEEENIHLTSSQNFTKTMELNNKFLFPQHYNKMAKFNERIELSLIQPKAYLAWHYFHPHFVKLLP